MWFEVGAWDMGFILTRWPPQRIIPAMKLLTTQWNYNWSSFDFHPKLAENEFVIQNLWGDAVFTEFVKTYDGKSCRWVSQVGCNFQQTRGYGGKTLTPS